MKAALRIAGVFLLILSFTSISKAAQTMNTQTLNAKQQAMVAIAAFSANGDLEKLKPALNEGLDTGLTINEIKEITFKIISHYAFS